MRISDWSLDVCSSDLKANSNQPSGTLYGAQRSYTVQANGQLRDAAAYNDAVIAYRNGAPVRLRDVGRAVDSIENDKQATEFNGRPSIVVAVSRQPGTNTVSRSEEHTSELQSLMRISYSVLCLKQKKTIIR